MSFFNCCLLLLLVAPHSAARRPWLKSLITFNTCSLISNNCTIKWPLCSMYMPFPSLHPQKHHNKAKSFLLFFILPVVGLFNCCVFIFEATVHKPHKKAPLVRWQSGTPAFERTLLRLNPASPLSHYRRDMMVSAYRGNEKIVVDKSALTRVAEEIPPASHRISSVPS